MSASKMDQRFGLAIEICTFNSHLIKLAMTKTLFVVSVMKETLSHQMRLFCAMFVNRDIIKGVIYHQSTRPSWMKVMIPKTTRTGSVQPALTY